MATAAQLKAIEDELAAIDAAKLKAIEDELAAIDAARGEEGEAMRAAAEPEYPAEQEFVGLEAMTGGPEPEQNWAQKMAQRYAEPVLREQMSRRPQQGFQEEMQTRHSQRSLLPGVTAEGEQIPTPDAGGLHARQAEYITLPTLELQDQYGGVVSREVEPPPEPEGVEGAFADEERPKPKDTRSPTEKGTDLLFGELGEMAEDVAEEVLHWSSNFTFGNVGRAWGAISLPFKEVADAWSVTNAVEEAKYYNAMVDDMARTLNNEDMLNRLSQKQVAFMRQAVADQRARRAEIHNYSSKMIETMVDMENVLKERVPQGFVEAAYMAPVNLIRDSRDIALGMGHLIFNDIMGLSGSSEAKREALKKYRAGDMNAADYFGTAFSEGVDSGEYIAAGGIGAAAALAGTVVPRGMHEAADRFTNHHLTASTDNSWRGSLGLGFNAFEAAPLTTAMFVAQPIARAVARSKGRIARGTKEYKFLSDQKAFELGKGVPEYVEWSKSNAAKYGAPVPMGIKRTAMEAGRKTPEYKRWRRGDGEVPAELIRAQEAVNRRKTALTDAVLGAADIGVEVAHEGMWRAKGAAKRKLDRLAERPVAGAPVRAARATRTNNQRANMVLQQWWSDALQQMDENSAIMANMAIRGTAEMQAAVLGLSRAFSEAALRGEVWPDAPVSKPPKPQAAQPAMAEAPRQPTPQELRLRQTLKEPPYLSRPEGVSAARRRIDIGDEAGVGAYEVDSGARRKIDLDPAETTRFVPSDLPPDAPARPRRLKVDDDPGLGMIEPQALRESPLTSGETPYLIEAAEGPFEAGGRAPTAAKPLKEAVDAYLESANVPGQNLRLLENYGRIDFWDNPQKARTLNEALNEVAETTGKPVPEGVKRGLAAYLDDASPEVQTTRDRSGVRLPRAVDRGLPEGPARQPGYELAPERLPKTAREKRLSAGMQERPAKAKGALSRPLSERLKAGMRVKEEGAGAPKLPTPEADLPPAVAKSRLETKPAEQFVPDPKKSRRNHVHGIFEHEWESFKRFTEEREKVPFNEALLKLGDGDAKVGGRKAATAWFRRPGQSRVTAALNIGIHRFSPEETAYFANQFMDYLHQLGPQSVKKAEYSAYRDVLLNRGLPVTTDYKNLGLGVEQMPAWADDAAWRAAVEESGGKAALDAGILQTNLPVRGDDSRWRTPAKVSDASEGELFAHVDRKLNERFPISRALRDEEPPLATDLRTGAITDDGVQMPFERRGAGVAEVDRVMTAVEEYAGVKFTRDVTHEAFAKAEPPGLTRPGVQQELPLFDVKTKFTPELEQRLRTVAKSIGVGPQYLTESFAQVLNWRTYPYFLKSQVAQNRIKAQFNSRVNAHNKAAKLEGRPQDVISQKQRGKMMKQLDGAVKSMSVGYGNRGIISAKGNFRFNIMDSARKTMLNDKKMMRSVLADATLSAGFKMADELRTAKVRDIARKQYAKAPTTSAEIWDAIVPAFFEGNRSPPALLRRSPEQVLQSLERRLESPEGQSWSKVDLDQAIRSLQRYDTLDKSMMDYLGLDPEAGPVYAPRAFARAIKIEVATQDMIKANNLMDRFVRSTKRNLVPANLATIIRNTMSDWNLLALQEGRPGVFFDVIEAGKDLHRFQTGKMKRAENPAMYEVYEAMERTGLVDATFLEANFGHARFQGTMSVVGDMIQGHGDGYTAWRWDQLDRTIEKFGYEPFLKTFRASTNAFKQYRAMKAFDEILQAAHKHRVGETFQLEVRPNRWSTFEVQPGGTYKHVDSGRQLTRQQWMDTVARTSKVTSDKLFFDYNDAGAWLKLLRAQPGVRWLMGSLFAMYYAKSATIPGVQKGLMFNVRNPNPAMRPGNDAVRYMFADKAAQTDARVSAMSAGARSAMLGSAERDALLDATGWRRNRAPMAAYYALNDGSSLEMQNFDFLDYHESTDTISRALGAGWLYSAEAMGLIPDDLGDLAVIYGMDEKGRKMNATERLNYKLEGLTKQERLYAQGLRRIKMRELKGEGFRPASDFAEMVFLRGGPLLEMLTKVQRAELSDRPVDMEEVLHEFGTSLMHGTFGKASNIALATADPASKLSTFKYQIKDPETVARNGGGALGDRITRWAISMLLMRMPKRTDLDPSSKANTQRTAAARAALRASLVTPHKEAAELLRNAAMIEENAERKAALLQKMEDHEKLAGRREAVIEEEVGRVQQAQGELLEGVKREQAREEKGNENAPKID